MDTTIRAILVFISLAFCGVASQAQSTFNGQIVPGFSTRDDVEAMMGKPVGQLSPNVAEYKAPAGYKLVRIEFDASSTVSRIGALFPSPKTSASLMQDLHFSGPPQASRVNQGALWEYYGNPVFLSLGYASTTSNSGVTAIYLYTPDAFKKDLSASSSAPQPAGAPKSAPAPAPPPQVVNNPAPYSPPLSSNSPSAPNPGLKRPSASAPIPPNPPASGAVCQTQVTMKLTSPIDSRTSRVGDRFTAQATQPAAIKGDQLTGQIHSLRCGRDIRTSFLCDLIFTIDLINHGGQLVPVDTHFVSDTNATDQLDFDEYGNAVTHVDKGGYEKVLAQEAMMASNGGNSNGPVLRTGTELTTSATQIAFEPGTLFTIILHSRTQPIAGLQCGTN